MQVSETSSIFLLITFPRSSYMGMSEADVYIAVNSHTVEVHEHSLII
jgi:hypothetical protein